MEVLKSKRGRDKIAFRGHLYRKDKRSLTRITWRCERRTCKGRIATTLNYSTPGAEAVETSEHNHESDAAKVEIQRVRGDMLESAVATNDPPRRILQDHSAGLSQEAAARIGSGTNLKRAVTRKRKREEGHPPLPAAPAAIVLPQQFRHTATGANFLLHDSGQGDNDRLLIFGTDETLQWLTDHRHWLGDGTFKVVPELFFQLYTVHVYVGGAAIPCIYALMRSKTQPQYDRLWAAIKALKPGLSPRTILTDFEVASRNSILASFPGVQLGGCFFHLGQIIWRRLQHEGLQRRYLENNDFKLMVKMLVSLAFLRPEHVVEGFNGLREHANYTAELDPLYDFFEDNYIGRPLRGRARRDPRFPIAQWNAFLRLEDNAPRTNNAVEAWHCAFHGSLQAAHPTLWRFLEALKREEALQRLKYEGIVAGEVQPRKMKYVQLNKRIQTIINDYENRTAYDIIRGIAYNMQLNP